MIKVLLIEDNEMNRDIVIRRLEKKSMEVEFAVDGREGIDKAKVYQPDIILVDMDLPIINGWEVTQILRENEDFKDIPIIAISAHAMAEAKEKAITAGCNEYIFKPIDFAFLLEKIYFYTGKK